MNTCSTCAHWKMHDKEEVDNIVNPRDPDTWEPMQMPFEIRRCEHPAKTFYERPVERNGFGLSDGSQYYAQLYTGPDFGCVRWEDVPSTSSDPS